MEVTQEREALNDAARYAYELKAALAAKEAEIAELRAEVEALRGALEGSVTALEEALDVLSDGHMRLAGILRPYQDRARAALDRQP